MMMFRPSIKEERSGERDGHSLAHSGPSFVASFLACLVECVEALTVVLAVGSVRSWSGALSGSVAAAEHKPLSHPKAPH
jgi:hypothetical protein